MTDKTLRVKYWKGYIKPHSIQDNPNEWLQSWYNAAVREQKDGFDLVVFRIPADLNENSDLIAYIERMLQDKLG